MDNEKKTILIVDDDRLFVDTILSSLKTSYNCIAAHDDSSCLVKLSENPHLILLDIEMQSRLDGLDLLKKIYKVYKELPVIMLSKHRDYKIVKDAILYGAVDYIAKPPDIHELKNAINRAINESKLKEQVEILQSEVKCLHGELIGESDLMRDIKDQLTRAASADSNLLITGETGTGKEVAARLVHELSPRKNEPFVPVNISAIEKELFGSELFGHEKGAFTGALNSKKGLFEIAGNGTLFLDEIGDLDMNIQVKLIRVIEEKKVMRIGSTKEYSVPARIIAATHQDMGRLVIDRKFRDDLFYRLNVFNIQMPNLNEITEDIPLIAEYLINRISGKRIMIEEEALDQLKIYDWRGNVRELRNILEISVIHADNNSISSDLIGKFLKKHNGLPSEESHFDLSYKEARSQFTLNYVENLLKKCNNNITKASRISGLSRTYIHALIKK